MVQKLNGDMKDVFNKLLKNLINPNTYYVLHCINEGIIPNNGVSKNLEIKRLQLNGWLTKKGLNCSKFVSSTSRYCVDQL